MTDRLVEREYWDLTYSERSDISPVSLRGFKHFCAKHIYEKKERLLEEAKTVLELGGGGSAWLLYLSERFPDKRFSALDYSDEGSKKLRAAVAARGVPNIDVWVDDFFDPQEQVGEFDLVYSHGVVEHFKDLPGVLKAHSSFLSENGKMLTIIPNMAGVLGSLTRWLDKDVYNIHIPHDLSSFQKGHRDAGLNILRSGYLCSNNFFVLSSCLHDVSAFKYFVYRTLVYLSGAVWLFENTFFGLPETKLLSPYIYVVSEKK